MIGIERIAIGSILVGCLVLTLKVVAWWITGSVALYSDALESIVNVAASLVALIAIRVAEMPADANHPYGHEKAEFFSAVIVGGLIMLAAAAILHEAWYAFLAPRALEMAWVGLAVNAAATALNASWGGVLIIRGRRLRSAALVADGKHLMADVVTSVGVAVGIGLAALTGYWLLDPLLAALTAAYVLWSGIGLIRESVNGLMDSAPDAGTVARVRALVTEHAVGALESHDLRMRHAGRLTFLDFHLVVPGTMTVADSHAICDRIEAALAVEMDFLKVTIHVEPESKARHQGMPAL